MRLSPMGVNFCCVPQPNFRAKFGNMTLQNMSMPNRKINAKDADLESMYATVHNSVNNVRQYGGKDTVIEIGAPYDTSWTEYPSSAYLGFSGENSPVIESDDIDRYSSELSFKNPILNGAEASVIVNKYEKLDELAFPVAAVAAGIGKTIIETGENNLVDNYIDRVLKSEKVENLGKTIQGLITKLQESKFSENAIKKLLSIQKHLV